MIDFDGRVLVHIGPHKTGTTTIQHFLTQNRAALLDHGILYPEAGRRERGHLRYFHHPLIKALMDHDEPETARHVAEMQEEIARHRPRTVILSSEVLARTSLAPETFASLRGLFPAARREWLMYLRRQDDLLISYYAERIQRGRLGWPAMPSLYDVPEILDHLVRIEALQGAVGEDRVIVKSFETARRDLTGSVLDELGVTDRDGFRYVRVARESLPLWTTRALRFVNLLPSPIHRPVRRSVIEAGKALTAVGLNRRKTGEWLDAATRERIRAKYAESNRIVEARYFGGARSGLLD